MKEQNSARVEETIGVREGPVPALERTPVRSPPPDSPRENDVPSSASSDTRLEARRMTLWNVKERLIRRTTRARAINSLPRKGEY